MLESIRPEHQLLLCVARTRATGETAGKVRSLLREKIDWDRLTDEAHRQCVLPLLHWHLEATDPNAVPEATRQHLRQRFHANARRNLLLTQELLAILELFAAHGIAAIPFKGPVLAALTYGNLAFREFADLDILVQERDLTSAKELLGSRRYRLPALFTPSQESAYVRFECEHLFLREEGRVVVELHWKLAPSYFSFAYEGERLWRGLTHTTLGGASILGFSPEDLLLILCAHGAKHSWERLGWICDVGEVLRAHPDLDWGRVIARARGLGAERMLLLGLCLAGDLLEASLPSEISKKIDTDAAVRPLAAAVAERLFGARAPLTPFDRHLFHLRTRERLRDRGRYLFRLASTPGPREWALVTLPGSLYFLYYGVRLMRLLGKHLLRRALPGSGLSPGKLSGRSAA